MERVIRGVRENNEAQYDAELATEMISTTAEERRGKVRMRKKMNF